MAPIPLVDLYAQYQSIQSEIDDAIRRVIRESAFIGGEFLYSFEREFAAYCQVAQGVGTSSGTTALHLAFAALGIQSGDEVITVPNTFIATVETIVQTGARPVFVDVCDHSLNMDPSKVEAAITPRTRAIVPVHLYGQIADMDPLLDIARRHKLVIVEDAAQAHGAEYQKKRAGHFGVAATFSFFPGKILGAFGDAGMVVSQDQALAEKMKLLSNHGRREKYEHRVAGFNYRLDPLQAAILSAKLKHLDAWIDQRRAHGDFYNQRFAGTEVKTPGECPGNRHVYTYYVIRVPNRSAIEAALHAAEIASQVHYPLPLHLQPAFKSLGYRTGDFPITEKAAGEILSLPLYPELEPRQLEQIACTVLGVFK